MEVCKDDCPRKTSFQSFEAECLLGFVLNSNWRNFEGFHHLVDSWTNHQEIPLTPCYQCCQVYFLLGDSLKNLKTIVQRDYQFLWGSLL
ncbi:hypothetical protein V6Z11_D11G349300 [Gossypium hirsutum]